jgi:aminoglycoside phosphotransferase (APT) family kinase protein
MDAFPTSLRPLVGGHSGETFLADVAGEEAVVRVYGGRSARRGPLAAEIDAAVLELVRGLVPVPAVWEVRRGDPDADLPGLLVTSRLAGERLDLVLPELDADRLAEVGAALGVLAGRLGHVAQPRVGSFADRSLAPHEPTRAGRDLSTRIDADADALVAALGAPELVERLRDVAADAQELADEERRVCLVHGDLVPANLLVDPDTLHVTGVLDWERAHAGSPYTDLGSLLRAERSPVFTDAVLSAYGSFMPSVPDDVLDRARAADLFTLVELATQPAGPEGYPEPADRARALLTAVAEKRDVHATPPKW